MQTLRICEIFYSLQGESLFQGYPCIFIRLSGCNLRCKWCDTAYSYESGAQMGLDEILQAIRSYPCHLVEITGGEPLCQPASIPLMQMLLDSGYQVLLESNGSLSLANVPPQVIKIVDVKCPDSGFADSFRLENLAYLQTQDELKFVLASRRDYEYALNFLKEHEIQAGCIHFSPVSKELSPPLLAEWMLADGVPAKLSLQLHKILNIS